MRGVQVPECAEVLVVHCATTVAQRGSAANKEERRWRRSPCVKIVSLRSKSSTRENAMQQFIEKYGSQILGVLTGWDRLVLRGSLRRPNYGRGGKDPPTVVAESQGGEFLAEKQLVQEVLQQR